ncbi:hypothetical protein [Streptomyces sp. NPDC048252]|uniref:hypothetical protein n=1 Tax=Streptomyces sp. NPDC048252 TaxID=3154612 RepID=UPI003447D5DC
MAHTEIMPGCRRWRQGAVHGGRERRGVRRCAAAARKLNSGVQRQRLYTLWARLRWHPFWSQRALAVPAARVELHNRGRALERQR